MGSRFKAQLGSRPLPVQLFLATCTETAQPSRPHYTLQDNVPTEMYRVLRTHGSTFSNLYFCACRGTGQQVLLFSLGGNGAQRHR